MRYLLILLITSLAIGGLTGCGSSVPMIKPFKMDIQQGNVVTSKMLLQLKPGMTKSQVRYIMGTPLIVDSFHKDRWDYFYQMRQAGKVIEQRRVILDFEKDLLTKVRGDVVPQGTAGADTGGPTYSKSPVAPAKKSDNKSWTEKLKFWKKDESAVTKPVEAPKAVLPEAAAASPDAPAVEDAPSILAVPIELGTPAVVMPQVKTTPIELPSVEPAPAPVKVEPVKPVAPKPAPAKAVEVPKATSPAPAPIKAVQPAPAIKSDDKKIFRLDRTLDPKQLEQAAAPIAAEPAAEKVVKPKKTVEEPLPAETEPGFFDRMLEKIGF